MFEKFKAFTNSNFKSKFKLIRVQALKTAFGKANVVAVFVHRFKL